MSDPAGISDITRLAGALPPGYRPIGDDPKSQACMSIAYDAGDEVWEIEWCALDGSRNFSMQERNLSDLLRRACERVGV